MPQPTTLVLASSNAGKIREFEVLLQPWQILAQSRFDTPEPDETGCTFVENAIIKARNAALHSGFPALADDSGLVVDALNGEPGVWSARFAGVGANDAANIEKLLTIMADVPDAERVARFVCVLVWMRHAQDPLPLIAQGVWEGRITRQPQGHGGFGYDPVFWADDYQCTAAELSPEQKNQLSHRGQALRLLQGLLLNLIR